LAPTSQHSLRDMQQRDLKQVVREIPTLPAVYQRLFQMMSNPTVSVPQLAEVVARDPSLSAKILQLVNSAFYGCQKQITTISRAMVVLGFRTVRNAAMAVSVFEYTAGDGKDAGFDMEKLWKHSLTVASICKVLGPQVGIKQQEDTFIAGLLHDVGKLIIKKHFPTDWEELCLKLAGDDTLTWYAAEKELFGSHHAIVAKSVFRSWEFPPSLVESAHLHHAPDASSPHAKLIALVHVADVVAYEMGMGAPLGRAPEVGDPGVYAALGLAPDALHGLKDQFALEAQQAFEIIKLIR
jgi:putative nucleotidyltransferase with HDIG domain